MLLHLILGVILGFAKHAVETDHGGEGLAQTGQNWKRAKWGLALDSQKDPVVAPKIQRQDSTQTDQVEKCGKSDQSARKRVM